MFLIETVKRRPVAAKSSEEKIIGLKTGLRGEGFVFKIVILILIDQVKKYK